MATTEPRRAVERDSWTLLRAPDELPSSPALAAPTGVATPSAPVVADGTSETTRVVPVAASVAPEASVEPGAIVAVDGVALSEELPVRQAVLFPACTVMFPLQASSSPLSRRENMT